MGRSSMCSVSISISFSNTYNILGMINVCQFLLTTVLPPCMLWRSLWAWAQKSRQAVTPEKGRPSLSPRRQSVALCSCSTCVQEQQEVHYHVDILRKTHAQCTIFGNVCKLHHSHVYMWLKTMLGLDLIWKSIIPLRNWTFFICIIHFW